MSGASTLRNAVKRVTHKERAQPASRARLGLLEKHSDYLVRAKDFQNKQRFITSLRSKARDRNPDEFYFHMHNSQVVNGVHREKGQAQGQKKGQGLDRETVDLLKAQDMGYIVYKKSVDDRKVEKLRENIHLIGAGSKSKKHHLFVDEEAELESFDAAQHFNTRPELLNRTYNRTTNEQLEKVADESPELLNQIVMAATRKDKKRSAELIELKQRTKRAKKLEGAISALQQQRNLSTGKGSKKKITLTQLVGKRQKEKEVTVFKWKRQRSK